MNDPDSGFETFLASPQQIAAFETRGEGLRTQSVVTAALGADLAAIRARFARIEAREEALRTTLDYGSEGVLQRVQEGSVALWTALQGPRDAACPEPDLHALARHAAQAIAPDKGVLLVLNPVEIGGRLKLLITASCELLDARSLILIAEELAGDRPGGDDAIAYADYAGWRSELLEAPENAVLRDRWERHRAADASAAPPSVAAGMPAAEARGPVSPDLTALDGKPVQAAAALVAAYLLGVSGRKAMPIAVEFDGRELAQLAGAVGLYAQYLPVEFALHADETVQDYLRRSAEWLSDAEAMQDFARDVLRPHSFGCAIRICDEAGGSGVSLLPAPRFSALDVTICKRAGAVCVDLNLNSDIYDAADRTRLLEGFKAFSERALAAPGAALAALSVIGPTEAARRAACLTGPTEAPVEDFIAAFRAQAARKPTTMAVSCGQDAMTYGALAQRASDIAGMLSGIDDLADGGVLPVVAPASIDSLAAMLGALWAGIPYAPLDPAHPVARLETLMDGLGATVAMASGDIAERLSARRRILPVGSPAQATALDPVTPDGAQTAYVIFTSGSTGAPKGVAVTRGGLSNYCAWAAREYGLGASDGALVFGSIAVDMTITGFLAPLGCGGTVHLPEDSTDISRIAQALGGEQHHALFKTTPSVMRTLLGLIDDPAAAVDCIVLGGEALYARDLDAIRARFGKARLINEYGPTETVVGSVAFDATDWADAPHIPVPIGRPIANTRLDVIEQAGRPAPFGGEGELWIAGEGVAGGYVSQTAETAARFVDGAYRTGDRVALAADGQLTYLGRLDDELKLNGVRCHPSEIVSAFLAQPGIVDAAVLQRAPEDGPSELIAFAVAAGGAELPAEVPAAVRDLLPAAMLPNRVVWLSELPKTASGKLDKAALLASADRAPAPGYESPQGHIEETLSAVICAALDLDRFGRADNYFAKGGDSLKSVQVSALAKRRGIDISVAQIHRSPVLSDMALGVQKGDALLAPAPQTAPFSLICAKDRALMGADIEDAYPLNLLQEGMIYHRDFAPKSAVYHAICSYRIRARLDVDLMRQVIHGLVARHPLLRTSFDLTTYSRPLQIVHKSFEDPLKVFDLRDASDSVFRSAVDGWMEHEKRTGFDVDSHPLIRYALHVGAGGVFQLSYSFHHEIIDGWSDAYMVTELLRDYFARLNGEAFRPPQTEARFRDAIAQEIEVLGDPAFKDFWMREFEGAQLMRLPRLEAPHRADKGEREIVKFEIPISDQTSDRLKALARELTVPLKTVLLAIHMRVMSVMGGARDTTSYTVGNGRPENADGHAVIGLFVNSLAFRLKLQGGSWRDLIAQTLAQEQKVLPYRRYPMAELKRQAGNDPLSETLFFFNHYHVADVLDGRADATLEDISVYGESTFPYCINAYISPVTKKIGMRVEYDLLQFTPRLLATMEQVYLNVIAAVLADPDAACDRDTLLPVSEHADIRSWGSSVPSDTGHTGIVARIDAAGRANPDRLVVAHDGRSMTWERLLRLSRDIAGWLVARGVEPGSRVALLLPRCLELPAVILGVLRAGCAYVPLDPAAPKPRTAAALEDAAPAVIIGIGPDANGVSVPLATLLVEAAKTRAVAGLPVAPEMPAYVIYTSGTTGTPKGVVVSHGALTRSTAARLDYYDGGYRCFLLLSSPVFDSSVAGIFGTLASGGTLVLPSGTAELELLDLAMLVSRHGVTHTLAVPSLYSAMLRDIRKGATSSLEVVTLAGEAVPADLLACHRETLPDVTLVNEYGPTEASVWASAWTDDGRPGAAVSLGRPVAGTCCSIHDEFGHVTPIGVGGEAWLAGPLLADGYLGRPAETAEAFRPDPAGAHRGGRIYRTGDVMRWGADGTLQFLGRQDNQVKLDGYRIELSDIEAALLSHPAVQSCVVQPSTDSTGKVRLTAYAVPVAAEDIDAAAMERHLRNLLPRFMLPDRYRVIDTVPLKPSGKIDRDALSASEPDADTMHVDPASATEEVLAGIWREVIGSGRISTHRRFFDLGGDSLRAMRIVAATQKALGVRAEMSGMMTGNCTIREQAAAIDAVLAQARAGQPRTETETVEVLRI